MIDLDAIEARAAKATKGPWHPRDFARQGGDKPIHTQKIPEIQRSPLGSLAPHDADFIAHAREDVDALTAEIRRLQALVEQAREGLSRIAECERYMRAGGATERDLGNYDRGLEEATATAIATLAAMEDKPHE